MRDFEEYEFLLLDGSRRYEIVDLSMPVGAQVFAFKREHGAVAHWPLRFRSLITSKNRPREKR